MMRAKVLPPPLQTSLHSCQVFLRLVMVSHRPKDSGSVLDFPETACFMISGEILSLTKDRNICCVSNNTDRQSFTQTWAYLECDGDFSFSLSAQFTHRKPSAAKVARMIAQEGWTANHPKPEDLVRMWKPASKTTIETDESFIKRVSEQTWKGLAIKDWS